MSADALRQIVSKLNASANALAALGTAVEARLHGRPLDPKLSPHVDAVVDALGARESLEAATPNDLRPLLGEIRAFTLSNAKMLGSQRTGAGWEHQERDLLQAAGDVSFAVPHTLKNVIAPKLEGLVDRLSAPGAAFLDVGVGVAVLSIEMARLWPTLRIVGVDPWAPALALARENMAAAGLADRIELREQAGEDLPDVAAFDLAWIPSAFVPERSISRLVARVHRALRPGGWLLFPTLHGGGEPLVSALARFRTASFGGLISTTQQVEELLRSSGFAEARTLPSPPNAIMAMVVARRPTDA
jgi:ubiquinone/menaquinone biosynthesis C-methylase UbiE